MKLIAGGLVAVALITTTITYAWVRQAPAADGRKVVKAEGGQRPERRKKVKGTASPQLKRYDDVQRLAADSQAVVVGVPVYQASHLSPTSSQFVWTDYRVKVLNVLKGEVAPGAVISLRTEGGTVSLPDGTDVETVMPDFWKSPNKGEGYVLFLSKQGPKTPYFKLTGGPQGLFLVSPWDAAATGELTASQTIVPQVRPSDKLTKNYQGVSAAAFLEELRKVIGPPAAGR